MMRPGTLVSSVLVFAIVGCGETGPRWECGIAAGESPDFAQQLGCQGDFAALASEPMSAGIPGARSVKTVIDRLDGDALYFQNSPRFALHYDFASTHLSGNGRPIVPLRSQFEQTEYFSPDRRFLLGAVTYYEGPKVWAYEISPYDSASAEMITLAYDLIAAATWFGADLRFHPTSDAVAAEAANLPPHVRVVTTEELFAGIRYQPLNLGTSMGQLRFVLAADLATAYVGFRDIVVLDAVPNDISVTSGIITAAYQTPLSHINVLSQNRGTPNMALTGAMEEPALRALEGKWVELVVGPFEWTIREVTSAEADAWWDEHRPDAVQIPALDLTVTDLRDTNAILDVATYGLAGALDRAIPAFGGKASHYGGLTLIGDAVPNPGGFAVPVYYYRQFMEQNGLDAMVDAMLADETFKNDPAIRDQRLAELRAAIMAAPVDPAFEAALLAKCTTEYPGLPMRFRSSTNAEDLDGFTGAGLYTSKTGIPGDTLKPVVNAVREVWSSVWYFRAFEEREYRSIDHRGVAMALLVHPSFPDEEANGVAITANLFDRQGLEPGFYVNVQVGEASVVQPDPGITTDQFIYHFDMPGQPIVFLAHSNLVAPGETVLTREQTYQLGVAMKAIHMYFAEVYAVPGEFYGMDIEFKFDAPVGEEPRLFIKQARPHPGWGL